MPSSSSFDGSEMMMIIADATEDSIDGKFSLPYDVKISYPEHVLLVSDHGNRRIQAFDLTTKLLKFKIELIFKPLFLELDIYDRLLIAGDDECIYCYDLKKNFEQAVVWRRGLRLKPGNGPYQFNGICGIHVNIERGGGSYGDIFISDSSNHRVKVLSKDGDFLYAFGKRCERRLYMESPFGISFNRENRCIVGDRHNHRIYVTDARGKMTHFKFGSRGNGEGEFEFPTSIVVDRVTQRILVCDGITNSRILIFSPEGNYLKAITFHEANPNGLCINHISGELYIADKEHHRIIIMK